MNVILPDAKSVNKSRVFKAIFNSNGISKQNIASELGLSLPTVGQCLKELYSEKLIRKSGYYESTGGRKANIITVNPFAKIFIGVELLKESIRITAVCLNGTIIKEFFKLVPFSNDEAYYELFGELVNSFIDSFNLPLSCFIGIYISVQGIVSNDGSEVLSGDILGYTGTQVATFQKYLKLPCKLFHDTELSAFAELWSQPDIRNAVYLVLNRYLGGSLIIDGKVYRGESFGGCVIEHMRLVPHGRKCYCRQEGCFDAYCSVISLEEEAGLDIDTFFEELDKKNPKITAIFDQFISYLALAINNIRMIADCDFVIGGLMEEYLTDEHLSMLSRRVNEISAFNIMEFKYRRSFHGRKAASRGAALKLLSEFIEKI